MTRSTVISAGESVRETVQRRAKNRCEYCLLPADSYPLPFQIDHILARQHGGAGDAANLALACMHCNRHKGPNIAGIDPETSQVTRLFHPRSDRWDHHFKWSGQSIVGTTDIGRATVEVLFVNDPEVVRLRAALSKAGVRLGLR